MQQRLHQMEMKRDELEISISKFESNPEDEYHKHCQENPEGSKDRLSPEGFKKMIGNRPQDVHNLKAQICTLSQALDASKQFAAAPPCEFKHI
eukprot:6027875-Prymnesium_polylepis.1